MGGDTLSNALDYAASNDIVGLPRMAAVLVTRRGDSYVGFNSRKSHPLQKKFGRTSNSICLHAEVDAIRNCLRNGDTPSGGSLYVARVFRNGQPALAKPCEGCERAIVQFGISEVEWTE